MQSSGYVLVVGHPSDDGSPPVSGRLFSREVHRSNGEERQYHRPTPGGRERQAAGVYTLSVRDMLDALIAGVRDPRRPSSKRSGRLVLGPPSLGAHGN